LVAEFFKTPKLTLPDAEKIVKEVGGDGSRDWTPQKLMEALDQHVVSQNQAKRLVAQAIRNKYRTQRIADPELRESMRPSNILV
jgi:ATP-dependent protease Clp ATPase subunit